MARNVPPAREPGRRGPPPKGIPLKQRRERGPARAQQARRAPADPVICRGAASYEPADFLQRSAEQTWVMCQVVGIDSLFGVSGWTVAPLAEPLPEGYARLSTLRSQGFPVVRTPELGRPGHVTIMLDDPVSDEQAQRFNAVFGRYMEESS